MSQSNYPHLFTPIRIGNFEARNRICHVPTDISSGNADGSVNQRVVTYHEEVAKGGCGFIIVGASTPDKKTGRPTVTCLAVDEDPLIPGLAELAEGMHRHGARCAVQIQHPGRQSAWPRKDLMSATDMLVDIPGSAGHEVIYAGAEAHGKSIREMTAEEIYDLIEKFGEGAWRVQQAGFDAVELHGAHGYLIAQFMSPYVNKRNDRFGGSFMGRMLFPLEIIDRIQLKCGKDFPIGIRYSGEEWIEGGRKLEESVRAAQLFQEHGAAWLDISAGIFEVPGPTMDPMYYPQGWNTYTAEEIKKHVSIPVITSHTLRDPDYCERILADGKADMVGFSRQLIADPYWANKAKAGKKEEIRKCISCLVGCWQESLMIRRHMRCAINPAIGDERFINFGPAEKSHTVAVVGGGPAGLEAARIATLRGHTVTVFEKSSELGGAILNCCTVQGKNKMRWYADWIRQQVAKLGVQISYERVPTAQELAKFDAVFVATGSKVVRPDITGIDSDRVTTFEDVLRCKVKNCEFWPKKGKAAPVEVGENVLIWGDHFGAADAAEKLGTEGKKVYIVTGQRAFASWMEPCHKDVMEKRFKGGQGEGLTSKTFAHPVTILTESSVLEIKKDGEVIIINSRFERSTLKVDTVVLADVEEDDSLVESYRAAGLLVTKIGDAKKVRNLRGAVTDGANAAFILGREIQLNANEEIVANLPTGITL
ncbi:MAG: FAD-dependent oxidoreductase [Spirochaetia bacterium]|jgi:2,4-dienoyl-CoA reductase-like NADH-dependent reductase (Old Yellow Enzyme family)/thioredoxin reductase